MAVKKIPVKKQPQKAAVLIVAAGDNRCHDVATFGQIRGKTVIKSVCVQILTGLGLVILRHQRAWAQFYLLTSHGRTHMIDGFNVSQR